MAYSGELVHLDDYYEAADKLAGSFGRTDQFTTGITALDAYLGGGYGVEDGYEIMVVFGETGVGKSTLTMNLIATEAVKGTKIGYMILEDDVRHSVLRLRNIVGDEGMSQIKAHHSIRVVPKEMLKTMWKLDEILKWIRINAEQGVKLFVIDHLQFIFENAVEEAKNEWHQQRKFMRDLNSLLDEVHATVIIVSHVNKGTDKDKGLNRIIGSSGIAGAASKIIGIFREQSGNGLEVQLLKSRHTDDNKGPIYLDRRGYKFVVRSSS